MMEKVISRFNKLIGFDKYKKRDARVEIEKVGTDFYIVINGCELFMTIYVEYHPYCILYDRIRIETNKDVFYRYFNGDIAHFNYDWLVELCDCISYKENSYYGIYYGRPLY
jgi:hypothetical protein